MPKTEEAPLSYNPYRKYCSRWWYYWLNLPGDVSSFIGRILDYAPLLWEDRDWDHAYLLRIMRFKIRRMRRHMEHHAIIADAEDHIAEMAQADVLLRNVEDEDPDNEWSMHWAQWHHGDIGLNDCKNPRECAASNKASFERERRNWRKLWRHFEKYAGGWWD